MIYLKDILFEAKVAHTQKSLQWVYHGYVAMTPKVIKEIMGDVPITTFHNLNPDAVKKQLKNKKKIKKSFEDNVNNPKITKFMSSYGYNELLVYDVKVKDAYIVIDIVGDPNDYDATEKALKQVKKDLKPFVKGKIYQGFADGVKMFVRRRGGKV
jgi:hypothetical protein